MCDHRVCGFSVRLAAMVMMAGLLISALGCTHGGSSDRNSLMARASRLSRLEFGGEEPVVSEEFLKLPPITVAILPFRSGTRELGKITGLRLRKGEERVAHEREVLARIRRQFYGYFSSREFRDREIKLIDLILEREGIAPEHLDEVPPQRLGSLLQADALIYGEVTRYRVIHGLVVSRVNIGLEVRMVRADTGAVLWKVKDVRCKNNWIASISIFPVVLGVYTSTVEVTRDHVARSVDFLCQKIVETLPEVDMAALYDPFIEAVMLDPSRVGEEGLRVLVIGAPGLECTCVLGDGGEEHRIEEVAVGRYAGFIPLEPGSDDLVATFQLRDPIGERKVTRSVRLPPYRWGRSDRVSALFHPLRRPYRGETMLGRVSLPSS